MRDFVVWLRFDDGTQAEVDLSQELDGPIFEPLTDPEVFRRFSVDRELHTLVWPNGADLASEGEHPASVLPQLPVPQL